MFCRKFFAMLRFSKCSAEPPETPRDAANFSGRGGSGGIFFRGLLCERFSQPR